jgi:tetratricopeptide (TPR) repeat protein
LQLGDSKAALDSYRQGLEISERLAKADPQNAQAQRDRSISYDNLGDVQLRLGDSKAALDSYRQGLAVRERLAKADPLSAQAQRDLLVSYFKLGSLSQQTFDFQEAAEWYGKALAIPKQLPKPEFFKQEVKILEDRLRFCQDAPKAVADLDFARKQPPDQAAALLDVRLRVLARKGDLAGMEQTADALAELPRKDSTQLYDAACAFALCSSAAGKDTKLTEADRTKKAREHADQAMDLLRQAVEKGYKDADHMKQDTDLDALRQRDDFKKLLADLEAPAPNPPEKK